MKNFTKKLLAVGAVSTLAALPLTALADDHNDSSIYVGGSYGYMKVKGDEEFDDSDDALQAILGFKFTPHLAVEGSLIDFGSYGSDVANASTDGKTLALKVILPFGDFVSLHAKGGQLWWNADYDIIGINGDADGQEFFYGIGAMIHLSEHLAITADYSRFDVDFDQDETGVIANFDADQDIDYLAAGVVFTF